MLSHIGPNNAVTPKIVNGSFAALFDSNDVVVDFSKKLQQLRQDTKDSGKHQHSVLKIIKNVSFYNIASVASYVYFQTEII